jgi:hypothetical protein
MKRWHNIELKISRRTFVESNWANVERRGRPLGFFADLGDRQVRFGSQADVTLLNFEVRFTLESGHSPTRSGCLLWANSRHPQLKVAYSDGVPTSTVDHNKAGFQFLDRPGGGHRRRSFVAISIFNNASDDVANVDGASNGDASNIRGASDDDGNDGASNGDSRRSPFRCY